VLTIKCAKCKTKLFKYKKIGQGRVLVCWKNKITRLYDGEIKGKNLICKNCGNIIAEIKEDYLDMNNYSFTYTGTKIRK
jgi:phage FluMu protein Com